MLLRCTATLRVQPCARGRRFSTSSSHHWACLCWRAGVLRSRRGWSRGRLLLWWRTGLTCQRQGGAGVPLNQLAQHKRRLWLQAKLTWAHTRYRHRTRTLHRNTHMPSLINVTRTDTRGCVAALRASHSRLNCEDSEVALDSEAFMSQLDEEGGGTGAPRPGSRQMEALLPWVLTGGAAWEEGSGPKPGPFSCSSICAPALGWVLLAWPKSPKPAPRTDDWHRQEDRVYSSAYMKECVKWKKREGRIFFLICFGVFCFFLPEQHERSLCCWWHCGWGAAAVAAAVAGGDGSLWRPDSEGKRRKVVLFLHPQASAAERRGPN